jgi:hypothetical protein
MKSALPFIFFSIVCCEGFSQEKSNIKFGKVSTDDFTIILP